MRDPGLHEAIRAVGSVSELARRVGISQPSVSNWDRVPADRVIAVEAATGIDRAQLRPDLFGADAQAIEDIDLARAQEYALLASLLLRAPSRKLLSQLGAVRADGSPLGMIHAELADAATRIPVEKAEREFFNLFIGLGRGELLPYGSYYLTGFLHERPLARLRADLAEIGIARVEGNAEPEDHLGTLCEIMSGLIRGEFGAPAGTDQRLFERHIAPWAGRFFVDLERAVSADFYRHVGRLGRVLIEIETEAFALPA